MDAYILNLDGAEDRWLSVEEEFAKTAFTLRRVPAVDGKHLQLPHPDYAERRFRWLHGRTTNVREVGCYLSHVKALRAFLESGKPHALIAEDDISLEPAFESVIREALTHAADWNILRLTGLSDGI